MTTKQEQFQKQLDTKNELDIPFKHQALARQLDIIPLAVLNEQITVIGAGAIGSFTVLSLAKMGFENITVFDFDKIEPANLNCQFYRQSDLGKTKVDALKELVKDFTGVEITAKNQKYEKGTFKGIVVSAVDSMEVRKLIWNNHKEVALHTKLLIDPRMGSESALCYAMKPMNLKDIESYEKTLYSDKEAVEEKCTAKSTMYCALALSSHVVKVIKDFLCNEKSNYTRSMQWNIKENAQQCYSSKN